MQITFFKTPILLAAAAGFAIARPAAVQADDCTYDKRIFIAKDVRSLDPECLPQTPPGDGAALSFNRNSVSGTSTATIDGSIGILLSKPRRATTPDGRAIPEIASKRKYTLMYVLEAAGSLNSGSPDPGRLRTGLAYATIFALGNEGILNTDAFAYYQTDLDGKSEAYGLELRLTPEIRRLRLNTLAAPRGARSTFYYTGSFALDAFRVEDAGDTNANAGDDFVWAVARLGFVWNTRPLDSEAPIKLTAEVTHAVDLLSDAEATQFTAGVTFPLNSSGDTSLGLNYTRGETRSSQVFDEGINATFNFKF